MVVRGLQLYGTHEGHGTHRVRAAMYEGDSADPGTPPLASCDFVMESDGRKAPYDVPFAAPARVNRGVKYTIAATIVGPGTCTWAAGWAGYVPVASAAGATVTFSKPASYGGKGDNGTSTSGGQIPGFVFSLAEVRAASGRARLYGCAVLLESIHLI